VNSLALRAAVFREDYRIRTKAILTEWTNRRITPEQLQFAANSAPALAEYLKDDFGKWRPLLRRKFAFKVAQISAEAGVLAFPGGTLTYSFAAENRDRGSMNRELSVDEAWFADGPRLAALFEIFGFKTQTFELEFAAALDPLAKIERLEESHWTIEREGATEVMATKGGLKMTIRERGVTFEGLNLHKLLAANAEETPDRAAFTEIFSTR
jgi:hypothetical protein